MGAGASSIDHNSERVELPEIPGGLRRWSRENSPETSPREGVSGAMALTAAFEKQIFPSKLNDEVCPPLDQLGGAKPGERGRSSPQAPDEEGEGWSESEWGTESRSESESGSEAHTETELLGKNDKVGKEDVEEDPNRPSAIAQHLIDQQYGAPTHAASSAGESRELQQMRRLQEDLEFAGFGDINDLLARAGVSEGATAMDLVGGFGNNDRFFTEQSKLMDLFSKESLDDQMAILEFAFQEATNGNLGNLNFAGMMRPAHDTMLPNTGGGRDGSMDPYSAVLGLPGGMSDDGVQVIRAWNLSLSSRMLRFSSDCAKALRQGQSGAYPAALVPVLSRRCDLTIMLEMAPQRTNWLSFGFAINGFPNEGGTRFGMAQNTWGIFDRRNTLQPSEIWDRGRRVGTCRPLKEGDELALSMDLRVGECAMMLNGTRVHLFEGLDKLQCYVMGSTLCDDHKVAIVGKRYSEDLPGTEGATMAAVASVMTPTVPLPLVAPQSVEPSSVLAISQGIRGGRPELASAPPLCAPEKNEPSAVGARESGAAPHGADALLCVICMDNAKSVLLLPCKHLAICPACDTHDMKSCPICRVRILDRLNVFVA